MRHQSALVSCIKLWHYRTMLTTGASLEAMNLPHSIISRQQPGARPAAHPDPAARARVHVAQATQVVLELLQVWKLLQSLHVAKLLDALVDGVLTGWYVAKNDMYQGLKQFGGIYLKAKHVRCAACSRLAFLALPCVIICWGRRAFALVHEASA
jgi:hypothetical protein